VSRIALLNTETGTVGRRPSGARLYHRGSRFGEPERRKLDRNMVARILFLAEALDRRTRTKGQHGGLLKAKGLDVLRALLKRFYSYRTGECFPSFEAIAEAAGCCEATAKAKVKILTALGILDVIRRKVVERFVDQVRRVRFDVPLQTSNSYVFNFAHEHRAQFGDLSLPLLDPRRVVDREAKFQPETSLGIKNNLPPDLAAALEGFGHAINNTTAAR
jgi:hypothetical protein